MRGGHVPPAQRKIFHKAKKWAAKRCHKDGEEAARSDDGLRGIALTGDIGGREDVRGCSYCNFISHGGPTDSVASLPTPFPQSRGCPEGERFDVGTGRIGDKAVQLVGRGDPPSPPLDS